jgi:predicted RNA binding protein YcfA (HicA-like mRNA interferase family)
LKLPRDLSGRELASLLARHGYAVTRQTGSHLSLTSTLKGPEHHVTIPQHKALTVGTLNAILTDVAAYLDMDRAELSDKLFGR